MESNIEISNLQCFVDIVLNIFNKKVPNKKRFIRANEAPSMNKTLKKAIMKRSRLRNTFLKNRTEENKRNYNKERNFCVNLLRKEKKNFFEKIDVNKVTDNKTIWKTVKPLFSNKTVISDKITLVKDNEIVSDNKEVADTFNRALLK